MRKYESLTSQMPVVVKVSLTDNVHWIVSKKRLSTQDDCLASSWRFDFANLLIQDGYPTLSGRPSVFCLRMVG